MMTRGRRMRDAIAISVASAMSVAGAGLIAGCSPPPGGTPGGPPEDPNASAASEDAAGPASDPSVAGPPPARARSVLSNDASWRITWWTDPATIPMHELHAVEVRVERAGGGAEPVPDDLVLTADARMPHHRHGMMVQPEVEKLAPDRFRVRGMMLHMSGYWEYYFDVESAGVIERAQDSIELE